MRHVANVPRIIHETLEDETILIDTLTGTYFSMRGAAVPIWEWLLAGTSAEAASATLGRLPGASGAVPGEVEGFWAALLADALIVAAEGEIGAPATSLAQYEPPVLEKFTDVQ